MAISPPNFQKDAIPTPAGWRHPRTNELLVPTNFEDTKKELMTEVKIKDSDKTDLIEELNEVS